MVRRRAKVLVRWWRLRPVMMRDFNTVFTLTEAEWNELIIRYRHRCFHCGRPWTTRRYPTMDRIIPGKLGGGYTKLNTVPSCGNCNYSRGSKSIAEFHAWRRARNKPVISWS